MRTRFPPSPTGMLHVGGLRTALYNYLIAKQTGGEFILRIEDTDQERSVPGAVENILESLHWAGLHPDEGVMLEHGKIVQKGGRGPYIQSERLELYREHALALLRSGNAYYAFDTEEEITRMREDEQKAGNPAPKYDAFMRMRMRNSLTMPPGQAEERAAAGDPHVIRLKVPEGRTIHASDEIRGLVEFRSREVDDTVLLKSDGFPTYHLANVVDDHLMKVDLVLRGEEWLPSLPKHLLLYEAFGWAAPQFAHVPLLLNKGGGKLSKRQGDVAASEYIAKGYLPEAMLNFLALLGWNPGTTQELFSLEELIAQFSMERIQKAGAVFDTEKLDWLQGQWMRKMSVTDFAFKIKNSVWNCYPQASNDTDFISKAGLIHERITFMNEAPQMLSYFYEEPSVNMDLLANKKQKVEPKMVPKTLEALIEILSDLDDEPLDWNEDHLKDVLMELVEKMNLKNSQILWPLRAALTGLPYSPGAYEVAAALGKEKTIERLQRALKAVS